MDYIITVSIFTASIYIIFTVAKRIARKKSLRNIRNLKLKFYIRNKKKDQYLNFFKLLDNFTIATTIEIQNKIEPVINDFLINSLSLNKTNIKKSDKSLLMKVENAIADLTERHEILKQENNAIKLISNKEVLRELNLLENACELSCEITTEILNELPIRIVEKEITQNQKKLHEITNQIQEHKINLMDIMKIDLRKKQA